jgi:hypothetical protein
MSVGKKKAPNHQQPPGTSKKIQLLDLPLEIRVLIYGHVLSTKDKHGTTNIYEIEEHGDHKQLQQYERQNNFQPMNFTWNHTALLAVNRQVREEAQTYCDLKMAFKFSSTMALRQFIYDGEYYSYDFSPVKINMLHAATKIEVVIGGREQSKRKNYRPLESLEDVVDALSVPLTVEFVATQSTNQVTNKRCIRFFNEAVTAWKRWMEHASWLDRSPRAARTLLSPSHGVQGIHSSPASNQVSQLHAVRLVKFTHSTQASKQLIERVWR